MSFMSAATGTAFAVAATFLCSLFVNGGNGAGHLCHAAHDQAAAYPIAGMVGAYGNVGGVLFLTLSTGFAADLLRYSLRRIGAGRRGAGLPVRRGAYGGDRRDDAGWNRDHDRRDVTSTATRSRKGGVMWKGPKMTGGQHSEAGRKARNDDSYGVLFPEPPLLETKGIAMAIADGMSSSEAAKAASETCIKCLVDDYYATPQSWSVKTAVGRVLSATNSWLNKQSKRSTSAIAAW